MCQHLKNIDLCETFLETEKKKTLKPKEDEHMRSASSSDNEKQIIILIDSLTVIYFKLQNHDLDPYNNVTLLKVISQKIKIDTIVLRLQMIARCPASSCSLFPIRILSLFFERVNAAVIIVTVLVVLIATALTIYPFNVFL